MYAIQSLYTESIHWEYIYSQKSLYTEFWEYIYSTKFLYADFWECWQAIPLTFVLIPDKLMTDKIIGACTKLHYNIYQVSLEGSKGMSAVKPAS